MNDLDGPEELGMTLDLHGMNWNDLGITLKLLRVTWIDLELPKKTLG